MTLCNEDLFDWPRECKRPVKIGSRLRWYDYCWQTLFLQIRSRATTCGCKCLIVRIDLTDFLQVCKLSTFTSVENFYFTSLLIFYFTSL